MVEEPQDSRFRTVPEIASYYRMAHNTVRRWISKGLSDGRKLQSVVVGGEHRIHLDRHLRPFMKIHDNRPINIPTLPDRQGQRQSWSRTAEHHDQPAKA